MARELILLRHAKSSWAEAGLSDHERPLNGRGRRQTQALADWLAAHDAEPDLVLCSSALRTQETWSRLRQATDWDCPVLTDSGLYLAEADGIGERVAMQAGEVRRVLVLGHNPGISELAGTLARREVSLRTACLAWFSLESTWTDLVQPGRVAGRLLQLACPGHEAEGRSEA